MKHSARQRSRNRQAAAALRRRAAERPAPRPAVTLARQQEDFTAEGSPPPGQVGLGTPVETPAKPATTAPEQP